MVRFTKFVSLIGIVVYLLVAKGDVVFATGYNYLPNDVYIKQQEEKSALEYRIRSLESQISGNPTIQISTLDSRISQLEREMQTEKNYITGLYAKNGIANQLDTALNKIDIKYESLINDLEREKRIYQNEIDQLKEIEKIQKQIRDIDAYYDKQLLDLRERDLEETQALKPPSAQGAFYELDSRSGEYWARETIEELKTKDISLYNDIISLAETKYYAGKTDPSVMFNYMDSLSTSERDVLYEKLGLFNPSLREKVNELVRKKYPDGKPSQAMTSAESETVADTSKIKDEKKEITKESSSDTWGGLGESSEEIESSQIEKPEKKSFFKAIGNFFQKLKFW